MSAPFRPRHVCVSAIFSWEGLGVYAIHQEGQPSDMSSHSFPSLNGWSLPTRFSIPGVPYHKWSRRFPLTFLGCRRGPATRPSGSTHPPETSVLLTHPIRHGAMFHWSEQRERKRHPCVNGWRLLPVRIDPPFEVCLSAVRRRRPLVPFQCRCPVLPSAWGRREGCDLSLLTTPRWPRTEAPACNPAAPSFARSAADVGYL
jgi:hypothetical protein